MYSYAAGSPGTFGGVGFGTVIHMTNDEFFAQSEDALIRHYIGPRGGKTLTREKAIAEMTAAREQWAKMKAMLPPAAELARERATPPLVTIEQPVTPLERSLAPRPRRPRWQIPLVVGGVLVVLVIILKR